MPESSPENDIAIQVIGLPDYIAISSNQDIFFERFVELTEADAENENERSRTPIKKDELRNYKTSRMDGFVHRLLATNSHDWNHSIYRMDET